MQVRTYRLRAPESPTPGHTMIRAPRCGCVSPAHEPVSVRFALAFDPLHRLRHGTLHERDAERTSAGCVHSFRASRWPALRQHAQQRAAAIRSARRPSTSCHQRSAARRDLLADAAYTPISGAYPRSGVAAGCNRAQAMESRSAPSREATRPSVQPRRQQRPASAASPRVGPQRCSDVAERGA